MCNIYQSYCSKIVYICRLDLDIYIQSVPSPGPFFSEVSKIYGYIKMSRSKKEVIEFLAIFDTLVTDVYAFSLIVIFSKIILQLSGD